MSLPQLPPSALADVFLTACGRVVRLAADHVEGVGYVTTSFGDSMAEVVEHTAAQARELSVAYARLADVADALALGGGDRTEDPRVA
ncbi:hypothetical protein ACIGO9_28435 [Nocardia asteroides]|uniref:hypothetical protein n=1 Tax=Nocardia asteroides TaxID=1824 RepID=UPI0037C73719